MCDLAVRIVSSLLLIGSSVSFPLVLFVNTSPPSASFFSSQFFFKPSRLSSLPRYFPFLFSGLRLVLQIISRHICSPQGWQPAWCLPASTAHKENSVSMATSKQPVWGKTEGGRNRETTPLQVCGRPPSSGDLQAKWTLAL